VCQFSLSYACKTDDAAVAALGADIRNHAEVSPVRLVGREHVGVAVASLPGRPGFTRIRTPFVDEEHVAELARQTAAGWRRWRSCGGERSGLWHPHLHVLVARPSCACLHGRRLGDGGPTYAHGRIWCRHALNQCCVSAAWREITDDSYVVDIRAVHADQEGSMAGAIREVVKYCTKLTQVRSTERQDGESDVLELHRAIPGRRLLTTVGAFCGLAGPDDADELLDDPESRPCPHCGVLWETVTAVWQEAAGQYALRVVPSRGRGQPIMGVGARDGHSR
jgi:hypothetical protein